MRATIKIKPPKLATTMIASLLLLFGEDDVVDGPAVCWQETWPDQMTIAKKAEN
jgi:hypothetical protein